MDRELSHKPSYIVCIVSANLAFIVACVFNGLAASGNSELVYNSTGDISNYYKTDITPAGWTFSIWGLIYAWQALWLIYSLSTICQKTAYGYLYVNPCHQPPLLYVIFVFNMGFNVGWLILWGRYMPNYALLMLALTVLSLYAMLYISFRRLYFLSPVLYGEGKGANVCITRVFTQNGLAIYAAWTTIALLINLDVVLIYSAGMDMSNGGTICLAALFVVIVTWFFLDNFVLDRFVRYTITPYFVFVFALTGSYIENRDQHNSYLIVSLLAVASAAFFFKLIFVIYRGIKQPIFSESRGLLSFQLTYGTIEQNEQNEQNITKPTYEYSIK